MNETRKAALRTVPTHNGEPLLGPIIEVPDVCPWCRTPYAQADGGCRHCCDTVWPDHMGSV